MVGWRLLACLLACLVWFCEVGFLFIVCLFGWLVGWFFCCCSFAFVVVVVVVVVVFLFCFLLGFFLGGGGGGTIPALMAV